MKTTPLVEIFPEADLPNVSTRATLFSTIAMEKSLRMSDAIPKRQLATAEVRQRTKKICWQKKPARYGDLFLGPYNPKGLRGSSSS